MRTAIALALLTLMTAGLAAQPPTRRLPGQPPGPVPLPPIQFQQQPPYRPQTPSPFPALLPTFLMPLIFLMAHRQQQKILREQHAEEEDRTAYTEDDLMQDWEFKILRCTKPAFHRREFLDAILTQEAAAGWQVVEVFDAQRVRLKRPGSARAENRELPAGYDPYRLYVADPVADARAKRISFWLLCGLSAIPVIGGLIYAAAKESAYGLIATGIGAMLMALFAMLALRSQPRTT